MSSPNSKIDKIKIETKKIKVNYSQPRNLKSSEVEAQLRYAELSAKSTETNMSSQSSPSMQFNQIRGNSCSTISGSTWDKSIANTSSSFILAFSKTVWSNRSSSSWTWGLSKPPSDSFRQASWVSVSLKSLRSWRVYVLSYLDLARIESYPQRQTFHSPRHKTWEHPYQFQRRNQNHWLRGQQMHRTLHRTVGCGVYHIYVTEKT